jgi:hypothetical protein
MVPFAAGGVIILTGLFFMSHNIIAVALFKPALFNTYYN